MDLSDILKLLSDPHRRQLLQELDNQTPIRGEDLPLINTETEQSPQVAMRHIHLPKLNESGAIDYDHRSETIVKGPAFEDVKSVLDSIQDHTSATGS